MYYVYCHTTPSNRKYVGISSNPQKRWNNGKGYIKNYLFRRAIEKYGWNNIEHKILFEVDSLGEAKSIEKRLISEWNLTNPLYGLNLSGGGDGLLSETTRSLMSKSRLNNKNCVGNKLSQLTKEKISSSLKDYYKSHTNPMKGKKHSEEVKNILHNRVISLETREKMRKNHANFNGVNNPSSKSIIQLTKTGEIVGYYEYASLASKSLNLDLSSIIKCCRNKIKTCGGFVWRYANNE